MQISCPVTCRAFWTGYNPTGNKYPVRLYMYCVHNIHCWTQGESTQFLCVDTIGTITSFDNCITLWTFVTLSNYLHWLFCVICMVFFLLKKLHLALNWSKFLPRTLNMCCWGCAIVTQGIDKEWSQEWSRGNWDAPRSHCSTLTCSIQFIYLSSWSH